MNEFRDGDYRKAEENFLRCRSLAGEGKTDGRCVVSSLYQLGVTYLMENDFEQAQECLLKALQLQQQGSQRDESETIKILTAIAHLYEVERKYEKALDMLSAEKELEEVLFSSNDPRLIRTDARIEEVIAEYWQSARSQLRSIDDYMDACEKFVSLAVKLHGRDSQFAKERYKPLVAYYLSAMDGYKAAGQAHMERHLPARDVQYAFARAVEIEKRRLNFCLRTFGRDHLLKQEIERLSEWDETIPDVSSRTEAFRMLGEFAAESLPAGDTTVADLKRKLGAARISN